MRGSHRCGEPPTGLLGSGATLSARPIHVHCTLMTRLLRQTYSCGEKTNKSYIAFTSHREHATVHSHTHTNARINFAMARCVRLARRSILLFASRFKSQSALVGATCNGFDW
jgi:hypothetical protein